MNDNSEIKTQQIEDLLRRLLNTYIDYPDDLMITRKALFDRVDWEIRANINDQGKLIGKSGSHFKAVQYVMTAIGEWYTQQMVIRLKEASGDRLPEIRRIPANLTYSCVGHKTLLVDILTEMLDTCPDIKTEHSKSIRGGLPTRMFCITTKNDEDYERLSIAGGEFNISGIEAIGTLFRAAGQRDGVVFDLLLKQG